VEEDLPAHDKERKVMQSPSEKRINASEMNVVEVGGREVNVMTLPSKEVDYCNKTKHTNTCRRRPNDDGISEKVVFDD
jgi:hypothetical protein